MVFTPYRPAQGIYARVGTAAALEMVFLFGSFRLYTLLAVHASGQITFMGMQVPYAAMAAGVLFIVMSAVVWVTTFGSETGLKGVDSVTRKWIDLLIDTEAELRKVFWPTRDDLISSTAAVLVSIVLLGVFLLAVDWTVSWVMSQLHVLPLTGGA
jgi:preprotein translocase SecE subunit